MGAKEEAWKKRLGANLPSPPEQLVFFVDRCLGRKIVPSALMQAGEEVRMHDDFFPQNATDPDWLKVAGQKGWVVVTKDKHIRHRGLETQALLAAGVRAFVLTGRGDKSGEEIGQIFAKALPKIKRGCAKWDAPFIAVVTRDSDVVLVKGGQRRRHSKG